MLLADLLPNIAVTDLGSHTSHLPLSALMKLLVERAVGHSNWCAGCM